MTIKAATQFGETVFVLSEYIKRKQCHGLAQPSPANCLAPIDIPSHCFIRAVFPLRAHL